MGAGLCARRAPLEEPPARPPPQAIRPCPKCGGANRHCQWEAFQETGNYPEYLRGTEWWAASEAGSPGPSAEEALNTTELMRSRPTRSASTPRSSSAYS